MKRNTLIESKRPFKIGYYDALKLFKMVYKHMKRSSKSYVIRELQIKRTERCH